MAKKKETKKKRYTAHCTKCLTLYESENLNEIPAICCGMRITINDNDRLISRYKEELLGFKKNK